MIFLVDPTVLFTKRGRAWINDVDLGTGVLMLTSNVLLQHLDDRNGSALGAYRPRTYWGYTSLPNRPIRLQGISSNPQSDHVSTRLYATGVDGHIAADLWHALQQSMNRNTWFVAHRTTTIDKFARAGVRLIVEGYDEYMAAVSEIEQRLTVELKKSLVPCVRLLVSSIARHPDFHWSHLPTLHVYDRGPFIK
jgi:hypothetical protein